MYQLVNVFTCPCPVVDMYLCVLAANQSGFMYQVTDICAVTAGATAELDALTVGMVCVRILQVGV